MKCLYESFAKMTAKRFFWRRKMWLWKKIDSNSNKKLQIFKDFQMKLKKFFWSIYCRKISLTDIASFYFVCFHKFHLSLQYDSFFFQKIYSIYCNVDFFLHKTWLNSENTFLMIMVVKDFDIFFIRISK